MLATIVDTDALWQTVLGAAAAGLGTILVFSFAILGVSRFMEANREGRGGEAILFGTLAVLGLLLTGAAVVIGVIVMTSK
ncbi:MAG: hypothetical protein ACJ75R_08905 [Solirubrobacterales bacterium]